MAAQLNLTKVRCLRWLRMWTARETSSLPVPVSPSSKTVESVGATVHTCSFTRRIASLEPIRPAKASVTSSAFDDGEVSFASVNCEARSAPRNSWEGFSCQVREAEGWNEIVSEAILFSSKKYQLRRERSVKPV